MALSHPTRTAGRLCVALAAILFSTNGFFVKAPFFDGWAEGTRGIQLAFWRAFFVAILLAPFVRRPHWEPMLLPLAAAFLVMNVAFLSSMVLTTAANTIWLQYTAPAWVFLGSALWLRDPIAPGDRRMLAFAVAGAGIIIGFGSSGQSSAGLALGLLAGVAYAGVVLCLRSLRERDPVWLIALSQAVTAAALLPFVIAWGSAPSPHQCLQLAGFGAFQMAIPYLLIARGVRSIPGHEASLITLIEPLLVPLWVWWAWHGEPSYRPTPWSTFAGGGLVFLGLAMRYAPGLLSARSPRS